MLRSMWRVVKAMGYYMTFRFDKGAETLFRHPGVIRAQYNDVIRQKIQAVQTARDAVAGMVRLSEGKVAELESVQNDLRRLQRLMDGALAMAKKLAAGKTEDQARQDPEFVKCMAAYHDFKTTIEQLKAREEGLRKDIDVTEKQIQGYEIQLQQRARELKDLEKERERSVADSVMSQQQKEAAELLSGIAQDSTAEQLRELRDRVAQARAEAKVTERLAGTDTVRQESEFMEMAGKIHSDQEFLGEVFGKQKEKAEAPAAEKTGALPE